MPGSLTPVALLVGLLTSAFLAFPLHAGDSAQREHVADSLSAALRGAASAEDAYATLAAAAKKGAEDLNPWSESRALLESALRKTREKQALDALRRTVRQVVSTLRFEPTMESAMPPGFPATTPAGEIVVKTYPTYRLARVETQGMQNAAFYALFAHIKQNDISMTAPVEMTYPTAEEREHAPTMAFLYGPDAPADPKVAAGIDVIEVEPLTVVSSGHRGWQTPAKVAAAKERIEKWLAQERPDLERVGPLRVLGYNSPMVSEDRRYFEVQYEVKPVAKKNPTNEPTQEPASTRTASF